jgi:amino acid transporter
LMAFLFIWQFFLSGPLEIASGYIGFKQYASYLFPKGSERWLVTVMVGVGLLNVVLLYRRITSIAKITVSLWVGVLLTVSAVIVAGLFNFNPKIAFDFPPNAFQFSWGFLMGLGSASRVGIYDYLGYYDICYIGDEVKNPGRVIPRSILLSITAVAAIYFLMNLSIIGVVPWREFVPAEGNAKAEFIVSYFMERAWGGKAATVLTLMVLWTAFGSCFALLLGYSRIPFAAAQEGYFFKIFGRLHPKGNFPHLALVSIGALAIACSFLSLQKVIDSLLTTRIVVQFIGQIGALTLLRKYKPEMERPYRIWLYPLPSLIALIGWLYLLATTPGEFKLMGLYFLIAGVAVFLVWSWRQKSWPFVTTPSAQTHDAAK